MLIIILYILLCILSVVFIFCISLLKSFTWIEIFMHRYYLILHLSIWQSKKNKVSLLIIFQFSLHRIFSLSSISKQNMMQMEQKLSASSNQLDFVKQEQESVRQRLKDKVFYLIGLVLSRSVSSRSNFFFCFDHLLYFSLPYLFQLLLELSTYS